MWSCTPDCREIVDASDSLIGERTVALLRGELEGLGPPDLCCICKVSLDRRLPRLFVGVDEPQEGAQVSFCHFVVGIDVSQPAPIAAYLCHLISSQEQPTGWFRRGWRVARCVYCTYNALHQQDLRVELFCQEGAPHRVDVRLVEASGQEQEGPHISPLSWGGAALSALMRSELPPEVPCLRVVRGPLATPWASGGCEGSRLFVELFEKHAGEGDLLGLLPSTGRGTNALCEVLAGHLLQSPALLPCVETLASLQGGSPLMALHISRAYARRGQLEAALSALLRCLHAYPEEACLLRQLAELLLRGGLHELAAKAAAYAVELCPTVPRYWLTLARAEIACGSWGDALLALNAAPDVSVSFPFYLQGLPTGIESYPITQPRQRGVGYYSFLWLTPVKPKLLPFSENSVPPSGGKTLATQITAASLRRSAKIADGGGVDSVGQGTARFPSSSTSPVSSTSGVATRDIVTEGRSNRPQPWGALECCSSTAAGCWSSDPTRWAGSEGGRAHHRGFGGSFGLAKGLDEEAVIKLHSEIVYKEAKPRGRGSHTDLEALSRKCSGSSTAEHLAAMMSSRALAFDLSQRRRYSVLASLLKRIGLRGIATLRRTLFFPFADDGTTTCGHTEGVAPFTSCGVGKSAAAASTRTGISSPFVSQEDAGVGTNSPGSRSFLASVDAVRGETVGSGIQNYGALGCMQAEASTSARPSSSAEEPSTSPSLLSARRAVTCSPAASPVSTEGGGRRGPVAVGVDKSTLSAVLGDGLKTAEAGSNNIAARELVGRLSEEGNSAGSIKDDVERLHDEGHHKQPFLKAPMGSPVVVDSTQETLQRSLAGSNLDASVVLEHGSGVAPRSLTPTLAGLLTDLEEDVSLFRLTKSKLSWQDLSRRHPRSTGQPESSWGAGVFEMPAELGGYWLYRGALCERLQEWVEMEAAYRIAITQGVSPLALRGLLRLYVRIGLAYEAIRIANVAAQQLSALCGVLNLPFLPAWLTTQLTRLVQSEGIEAVVVALESVPRAEVHPVVQQLIETQRNQLQAEG